MARYDVYQLRGNDSLVLDCQADLLSQLSTRFVVPLVPRREAPPPMLRLNPVLAVGEKEFIMMTQFAAAVERRELGPVVSSLAADETTIGNALDFLTTGV